MTLTAKKNVFFPSVNTVVDDFFSNNLFDWNGMNMGVFQSTRPLANMQETPKEFVIELAAPGLKKEDFNIELKNNTLQVSCDKPTKKEKKEAEQTYNRKEFQFDTFIRTFALPEAVNDQKILAKYTDGILSIELVKKEITSPKVVKKIAVK
jgi:HSP20 family protein